MTTVLLLTDILLLASALVLARAYLRERARRKQRGLFRPWPIRQMAIEDFDELFKADELGPTPATEVRLIGTGSRGVPGSPSDLEAWVLAALAKRAETMFEFGTCTGRTTYLWARNSGPDARIHTLTLPPEASGSYRAEAGDERSARRSALGESIYTRFRYAEIPERSKVTQLYGDSKQFDETAYLDSMDLVFVDGSHAASYVVSDSRKALRMLKRGGIVLWHDYHGPWRTRGVFHTLNNLAGELPLVHLKGTTLVAYRKPTPS